eukprot:m51a1_g8634 hypothetical protein (971) ;mRNA; r:141627-146058
MDSSMTGSVRGAPGGGFLSSMALRQTGSTSSMALRGPNASRRSQLSVTGSVVGGPGGLAEASLADGAESRIFDILTDLESDPHVSLDQVEYYRYKASSLVQTLRSFAGNVEKLGDAQEALADELERGKEHARRMGDEQFDDTSVAAQLSRDKGRGDSELAACKQREAAEQDEIERLEQQKQSLSEELEAHRQTQENVLQPRLQALRKANDEAQELLERERVLIAKLNDEKRELLEQIERNNLSKARTSSSFPHFFAPYLSLSFLCLKLESEEQAQAILREIGKTRGEPAEIKRQADQLEQVCQRLRADISKQEEAVAEVDHQEREVRHKIAADESESRLLAGQLEKFRVEIDTKRDAEARRLTFELHRGEEQLASKKRDFARIMKALRRKKIEVEEAAKSVPELEGALSETRKQLVKAQEERQWQRTRLDGMKMELDIAINALLNEQDTQTEVGEQTLKLRREIDEAKRIVSHLAQQESALHSQHAIVAAERETRAHEAAAARGRMRDALKAVRAGDMEKAELERRVTDLQGSCADYIGFFERVKAERNKYSEVISKCLLIRREFMDKLKVAESEFDILQQETVAKDHDLAKARTEYARARQAKDDARADINKHVYLHTLREEELRVLEADKEKLETSIRAEQRELAALRREFENAIATRNAIGNRLVNRTEELCLLYARSAGNDAASRSAELEMQRKEEEERFLQVVLEQSRRDVALSKREMDMIPTRNKETIELREQLKKVKTQSAELAAKLESPADTSRWTALSGEDPSQEELIQKHQALDDRLKKTEAALKARRAIMEELEKRRAELQGFLDGNQHESVSERQATTQARIKIMRLDEKIVATLAEVALLRAHVVQLGSATKDLEMSLEEARTREASGLAPTADAEREWFNMEIRRQLKLKEMREREEAEAGFAVTSDGLKTKAVKRFNAYVPDDGIGLPKPYGSHPPFKASDTAATRIFKAKQFQQ